MVITMTKEERAVWRSIRNYRYEKLRAVAILYSLPVVMDNDRPSKLELTVAVAKRMAI